MPAANVLGSSITQLAKAGKEMWCSIPDRHHDPQPRSGVLLFLGSFLMELGVGAH